MSDFELNEETAEKFGIPKDKIGEVSAHVNAHVVDLKGEWDKTISEKANELSSNTLEGATKKIEKESGIARLPNEQAKDYFVRVNNEYMPNINAKLAAAEQKLIDAEKDGASKEEMIKLKEKFDALQVKEAEFDTFKESGIEEKYNALLESNSKMKDDLAFNSNKPRFAEGTNEYEADAKWNNFVKETKALGKLEKVDDDWVIIDKDNANKVYKLADLVAKNKEIQGLVDGRQQPGTGARTKDDKKIEGVPFAVPANATAGEKQKLIREHLTSKGVDKHKNNKEYTKQFQELYLKIKSAN